MKTFIIVILFIIGVFIFFIPLETKILIFDKVWIDSSKLVSKNEEKEVIKEDVVTLKFDENNKVLYSWNISNWKQMTDFAWASLPNVNCFKPTENSFFSWNMQMHRIILWKRKTISVKLISDITDTSLNMFVYKTDALNKVYPPEKEYVHDCKIDISTDSIKELEMIWNTITSDIVIWISWWSWTLEWWYTLELKEK